MISKKELKKLIETIGFKTSQTQEGIALGMGYGKNYISEMLSPTGKITDKFIIALKSKYPKFFNNPNVSRENPKIDESDERTILDKYILMLEKDKSYFQELVKTNLMALLNQQRYIHADIKGIAKREAERDVNGNQVQLKKELHKISIYAGEYLGEGAKADNQGNEDK